MMRGFVFAITCLVGISTANADRHFDARAGIASDRGAMATVVGASMDVGKFRAGIALEWNPFFSFANSDVERGALNVYATLARTWYASDTLSLYSRAELGSSTLLFELVGVDRYSTGVYFGGSLLGVRVPIRRCWALTFDPSHVAIPTPQVTGFPFYYRQYRISVGVDFRLP